MLRLKCDVHRWMTAYIGWSAIRTFAVSGTGGTFEIATCGWTYTIQRGTNDSAVSLVPFVFTAGATTIVDVPTRRGEATPNS